jgi:hypothetical protein
MAYKKAPTTRSSALPSALVAPTILSSVLLLMTATLLAQQGVVNGPIAGYVFDARTQSLRSIRGVPGAAQISDAVDFGAPITAAWTSPKLDSALVVTADGVPHIYRLDGGRASEMHVDGLVAPARALFSPSGTALGLVTPGSVRIFKGLPDAPVVTGTVELPTRPMAVAAGPARGKLRSPGSGPLAVSDDGLYLLYGNGSAIEILPVAADSRKLTDAAENAIPVFAPGGHDAAVIDAQAVSLFSDVAGAATVRRLLPGIAGVSGAAFSGEGKRLFVASASVVVIDAVSGDRNDIACNCHPSGLARMGSSYRLNDLGAGPLWLFDAAAEPRIVFVPAAAPAK